MIKEAITEIVALAAPEIYEIGGDTYTTRELRRVAPHIDRPEAIGFASLDGVVQAIKAEIEREEISKPVFINVESHKNARVFTTLRGDNLRRDSLYTASAVLPHPHPEWSDHEDAIIMLRSRFVPNEDVEYLLDLLSRISSDDSVTSNDNGVSQNVTATTGVALKTVERVKSRVSLAPYRTFLEVAQPESEFILRVQAGDKDAKTPPRIGIIEADGGAWKLAAKRGIADYFRRELAALVESGAVIVTE